VSYPVQEPLMLVISGVKLREERDLIREYTLFVLNHFVSAAKIAKSRINLLVRDTEELPEDEREEFDEAGAWMTYDGKTDSGMKKFTITIHRSTIKTVGQLRPRMRSFLKVLGHELVHVKQYLNHEMFDYSDGERARFKGRLYSVSQSKKMDWQYYESPWEVEAYGRAVGLYDMWVVHKYGE